MSFLDLVGGVEGAEDWGDNDTPALGDTVLDRLHQAMILFAAGRSAALAQYETCRRILAEELGIEPVEETKALYEQIQAGGIGPAALEPVQFSKPDRQVVRLADPLPPPNNLPAQTTSFVGRSQELLQIQELLSDPDCRILTLIGPGGIGKTRLAMQAATQLVAPGNQMFVGGVYFVHLAEVPAPDPSMEDQP